MSFAYNNELHGYFHTCYYEAKLHTRNFNIGINDWKHIYRSIKYISNVVYIYDLLCAGALLGSERNHLLSIGLIPFKC